MTIDDLMRETLRLVPSARAGFARGLVNSLESLTGAEVEQLWVEEAVRRDSELAAGMAGTVSAEDALARARARRG